MCLRASVGRLAINRTEDVKVVQVLLNMRLAPAINFPHIDAITRHYGITAPLRLAHFLAQTGHESGELRWTSEFASGAAYEGRAGLGNTQPGDGKRFRGRGLIQITGRANYTAYGKARGLDYTTDASAVLLSADPATAVDASCWFWRKKGLNELADRDDFVGITRRINGATNGLVERGEILDRARFFLT